MGGSGISAAFSPALASRVVKWTIIPILFGTFVLLGAMASGRLVNETLGSGIIDASIFNLQVTSVMLFSIGLSILFANLLRVPQSTSQSTVLSIIAIGLFYNQFVDVNMILTIVSAWFYLPFVAFLLTYFIGRYIYEPLSKNTNFVFKITVNDKLLDYAIIFGALYVSYAIGANNVANAAAPITSLASEYFLVGNPEFIATLGLLIIAPRFGIGGAYFGPKIIKTSTQDIVNFGKLGATLVMFITGTLIILASITRGLPVALAQINIGAILGLAVYKNGFKVVFNNKTVYKILTVWIISPIISFLLTYVLLTALN